MCSTSSMPLSSACHAIKCAADDQYAEDYHNKWPKVAPQHAPVVEKCKSNKNNDCSKDYAYYCSTVRKTKAFVFPAIPWAKTIGAWAISFSASCHAQLSPTTRAHFNIVFILRATFCAVNHLFLTSQRH